MRCKAPLNKPLETTMKTPEQQRKSDLAKIHLAKKQCGMQDIEYRTLVQAVSKGRTDSAGELDVRERGKAVSTVERQLDDLLDARPGRRDEQGGVPRLAGADELFHGVKAGDVRHAAILS